MMPQYVQAKLEFMLPHRGKTRTQREAFITDVKMNVEMRVGLACICKIKHDWFAFIEINKMQCLSRAIYH